MQYQKDRHDQVSLPREALNHRKEGNEEECEEEHAPLHQAAHHTSICFTYLFHMLFHPYQIAPDLTRLALPENSECKIIPHRAELLKHSIVDLGAFFGLIVLVLGISTGIVAAFPLRGTPASTHVDALIYA